MMSQSLNRFGERGEFKVLEKVSFDLLDRVEDLRCVFRVGCRGGSY